MIKQHRTIYKTIKSRAETFVGCIFDEIFWRLWSHLSSSSWCGARALQREKKKNQHVPASAARTRNAFLWTTLLLVALDVKEDVETLEDWVEVEHCNENDIVLVFACGGSVWVFARAFSDKIFVGGKCPLRVLGLYTLNFYQRFGQFRERKIDTILDCFK